MNSKVIKKLEESYERIINVGLCLIPYEDLSDIVDPNVMIFGTTKDETILSFKNLDILIKSQYEQMGDVKVQLDRNRIYTNISDDCNYAIITESVKMTMLSPDSINSINIRCSSVMEFIDNKWKLTHWHASTPVDTENDHWHKEEWRRENEKLQKLVDEQLTDLKNKNRDLEVEAALERVRTVAMGMRNPKDMLGICRMISDQLQEFGVEHIRNVQTVIIDEETSKYSNYQYFTEYDFEKEEHVDYRKNPVVFELVQRMLESTDGFFTGTLSGNEFNEFRDYRKKEGQFPDPKLDEIESVDYHFFSIGSGGLGITLYRTLDEPNIEIFKRFHSVFSLAYQRFLDIQKAEAQAHEALIELSLERIRAQATAMKESSDLLDIVVTMRTEFVSLGHEAHYFWHMRWLPEKYEKAMTSGDGTRIGMVMTLPRHIHGNIQPVAEWEKSKEPIHVLAMDAETAVDYVEKMISLGDFERIDPQAPTLDDVRHIGGLTFVMARTTHGEIGFSLPGVVPNPSKSAVDTLMRFAAVFDLAYKRFEDLKVAERQHREAQIELALERVRARSMAMHKSDELAELSLELVKQVQALGVETWFCAFNIYDDDPRGSVEWGSNGQGTFPEYRTPREGVFLDYYEAGQRGDTLLINEIGENECTAHYEYLCSLPGVGDQLLKMKDAGVPFPTSQIDHVAFFKFGYVLFITFDPAPEAHEIFKRFAKVFEQTYTRFLDLQKAEEQTREAQVNLAVERVRARALAMFKSEEILDVVHKLKEEIMGLDIPNVTAATIHLKEPDGKYRAWDLTSISEDENELEISLDIRWHSEDTHPDFFMREVWDRTEDYFVVIQGGDRYKHTVQWLHQNGHSDYADEFKEFLESSQLEKAYHPTVPLNNGRMCIDLLDPPSPEIESILKKMAGVFDQTYTRFLDLKKAEARTKESQIELSLERIRSQVTAMQESSDLFDIVVKMRSEFISLGHEADYFWHMRWQPEVYEMSMTSEDGHRLGMVINIPKFVHDQIPGLAEWEKSNDPIYVLALDVDDAWDYIENMNTHGHYEQVDPNAPSREDIEHIGGLTFIIARTSHGEIGYSLSGVVPDPPEEALDTLVRFASVFDLAYQRFEDLQESEQQARLILEERDRLEAALKELHATQDQLVQQEKLASLGQLTAGIAHEIKNPLNFVNNFSDVSLEMVGELREEVKRGWSEGEKEGKSKKEKEKEKDENRTLILEILDDIKINLTKIHEHGTRADSIVKSMLMHSRGGSGQMESTDLNALVKEYVNLAFHGMRAGKHPIDVDMDLKLDDSVGKVPLIAEDFSRVIMNLSFNAFDAMGEQIVNNTSSSAAYKPKLTVRTSRDNDSVSIDIQDNGPGIPDDIKDKVLQPFFTTKKGTHGTGLGLSITHDIIKAHGGELSIQSKGNEGTEFTIKLPG